MRRGVGAGAERWNSDEATNLGPEGAGSAAEKEEEVEAAAAAAEGPEAGEAADATSSASGASGTTTRSSTPARTASGWGAGRAAP